MKIKTKIITFSIISILLIFPFGKVISMQSTNYKIEKDSINFGGTDDGQSTNYNLDDTMGEVETGLSDSANYQMKAKKFIKLFLCHCGYKGR